ncbi:unnamed protein product [Adineta ricciae]|uniref:Condensation domain-containing protein n=1 Tax=Adineta ricciae TaxID=249248 RepID=A0A815GFH4_ADIRI|nr:unnamed protein product [Adineta ricciae]CAF1559370.1 unnamed protein product [Adineta ricciae]
MDCERTKRHVVLFRRRLIFTDSMGKSTCLSLCDVLMPCAYIYSLLIFDYEINSLEKEFLHIYCPQAFQCMKTEQIVDCVEDRQAFSYESRSNESLSKYFHNDSSIDDLFPYSFKPNDVSSLIFLHQIRFDDGTILVFGCHHYFSDGHGFSLLRQRFSLWLKGKRPTLLDHDRSKLNHLANSSTIQFEHKEMSVIESIHSFDFLSSTQTVIKHSAKENLFTKLGITNEKLSTNDVLVGWLTQIISRIRQLPSETTVKVGMALNTRMFLPDINENYFGNASFYVCFSFSMIDLLHRTVTHDLFRMRSTWWC